MVDGAADVSDRRLWRIFWRWNRDHVPGRATAVQFDRHSWDEWNQDNLGRNSEWAGGVDFYRERAGGLEVALVMMGASIAGGYVGPRVARELKPEVIRKVVIVVGIAMTIYFFYSAPR